MSNRRDVIEAKGICDTRPLPDKTFEELWDAVIIHPSIKDRLLGQAVLNFTIRPKLNRAEIPFTGSFFSSDHQERAKLRSLAGSRLGQLAHAAENSITSRSSHTLLRVQHSDEANRQSTPSQLSHRRTCRLWPLIVVLDEVETLAADRSKMSLEANPIDVHRATDAVLAQLDQLAARFPNCSSSQLVISNKPSIPLSSLEQT